MALFPKPHSSEWFEAMLASDPAKAIYTQQIIKSAGHDAVCSVCGDEPAHDYQLNNSDIDEDAVATLRLCDDCHMVRAVEGEEFIRMK